MLFVKLGSYFCNCTSLHSINFHWGPTACWTLCSFFTHMVLAIPVLPLSVLCCLSQLLSTCLHLLRHSHTCYIRRHWSYPNLKQSLTSLFFSYPIFNSSVIPVCSTFHIIQTLTTSSNPQHYTRLQAWVTAVPPDRIIAPRLSVPMTLVI